MERLRASSPEVGAALDAYMDEHGRRIFTGFDLTHLTMLEAPESVLASIAAHLQHEAGPPPANDKAATLRERVPTDQRAEFDSLFETARLTYGLRDSDVGPCGLWPMGLLRLALLEAGRRLVRRGRIAEPEHLFNARTNEVEALLREQADAPALEELVRRVELRRDSALNPPPEVLGDDEGPPPPAEWLPSALARVYKASTFGMAAIMGDYQPEPDTHSPVSADAPTLLRGLAASSGVHEGRACLVRGAEDFSRLQPGDVLVAPFTTPTYNVVLPMIGGVVTDHGGILSHAAIVAREYAIPAVVGTGNATLVIPDGARVRINGDEGTVEVMI
jgi:pyruvate,water dikinase